MTKKASTSSFVLDLKLNTDQNNVDFPALHIPTENCASVTMNNFKRNITAVSEN